MRLSHSLLALPLLLAACDLSDLAGTSPAASKKSQVIAPMTRDQAIAKFGTPLVQKQYPLSAVRDSDRMMTVMNKYPPDKRGQSASLCECQWKDGDATLIVLFDYDQNDWQLLGVVEPTGGSKDLPRMY